MALLGYGAVLAVAIFDVQDPVTQIVSYVASAYALVITITGLPYLSRAAKGVKRRVAGHRW